MGDLSDSMSASFCGPPSEFFAEAPLVPFIDLAFRLEPIVYVAPVACNGADATIRVLFGQFVPPNSHFR